MAKTILEWSCNRGKFERIVIYGIKEILGRVNNTAWELAIRIENRYHTFQPTDGYQTYCPYPFWTFELHRSTIDAQFHGSAKLICNDQVWSKDVYFDPQQKSSIIFTDHKFENWVDYRLDFFLILENTVTAKTDLKEEYQVEKLRSLSTRLQTMLEKEHMTDVVLKCGSVALKAHKSIITFHSPIFEAMFANPMLEKGKDLVVIKNMHPSVLRAMIRFMYSGQVKGASESMIHELLYAAEKYQVEDLKEGCIELLRRTLNRENAIRILEISDLFDRKLKLECVSYINNNFEELKSTKDWKDLILKNSVLALEVSTSTESN